jgi:hypothetical protein
MQTVKRDQLWDVIRGGEWCRAHVLNVISDRVNLQFSDADPARGNAVMVTLKEMNDSARFRFVADCAEPPA